MFIVFICLVTAAAADYYYYTPLYPNIKIPVIGYNGDFLSGLSRQMEKLDDDLQHMNLEIAKVTPTVETTMDQYVITYQLPGFQKTDIEVEVDHDMLCVKAFQRNGRRFKSHTSQRNLPEYVDPNGKWAYIGEILRIVFPLKGNDPNPTMSLVNDKNVDNTQETAKYENSSPNKQ